MEQHEKRISDPTRRLYYHDNSESYVETFGTDSWPSGDLEVEDVTGVEQHEIGFLLWQYMDRAPHRAEIDAVRIMYLAYAHSINMGIDKDVEWETENILGKVQFAASLIEIHKRLDTLPRSNDWRNRMLYDMVKEWNIS